MLYLELKISILPPLEGNDKRHKMNSNNNRLKHLIYQKHFKNVWAVVQHSCKVWWISQSVCIIWVLYVQLCNCPNNFCLMQSFFQNISQCNREKHHYVNFHTDMFYIKLFICTFLFKITFRANIYFQWFFFVVLYVQLNK